jgi:hypothetical protein
MSQFKKRQREATRIVTRSPKKYGKNAGGGIVIEHNIDELEKMLVGLDKRMHWHVMDKAVEAAAEVVKVAASMSIATQFGRSPNQSGIGNSSRTGTRSKWSQKVRNARLGSQQGDSLSNKIKIKLLSYKPNKPAVSIIGADYYGNNYTHTHEPVGDKKPGNINLWGTGKKYQLPKREWLKPAATATSRAQMIAMKNVIRRQMRTL